MMSGLVQIGQSDIISLHFVSWDDGNHKHTDHTDYITLWEVALYVAATVSTLLDHSCTFRW